VAVVGDVVTRPERDEDRGAITDVLDLAFAGPQEGRLVEALRSSAAFIPELALVAIAGDRIVGHILFSRIAVIGERPGPAVALAPMAVLPSLQRSGIGSALVRAGLAGCRRRAEGLVVVLGHPGYYVRFGFLPAHQLGVLPPFEVPREAWMALSLRDGHPRGTVRYPPALEAFT
jgi:putative acetyltransferase